VGAQSQQKSNRPGRIKPSSQQSLLGEKKIWCRDGGRNLIGWPRATFGRRGKFARQKFKLLVGAWRKVLVRWKCE
jgi:hypothetical protein